MLPNEVLDKIFQYRYYGLKNFFLNIKKVNREYHQLFYLRDNVTLPGVVWKKIYRNGLEIAFPYNYRPIKNPLYRELISISIYNPNVDNFKICPKLPKNY